MKKDIFSDGDRIISPVQRYEKFFIGATYAFKDRKYDTDLDLVYICKDISYIEYITLKKKRSKHIFIVVDILLTNTAELELGEHIFIINKNFTRKSKRVKIKH